MGIVIGTAGHIDHGKSSLVKALTGVDPDRLVEEQRRGITIELGFAQLDLGDGLSVSLVDVPGHEALVRTMVAGATGIDAVLLVVAADEGIMPQTKEHLAIVQLLGIDRGFVVLSKADRVDEELLELAQLEVSETLQQTSLANAPIVAVSSTTGQGLSELKAALRTLVNDIGERGLVSGSRFRLPIDRVFTMRGFGTVVTGSSRGGPVAKGDTLEMIPGGLRAKVRGLQVHGRQVEQAAGSQRLAINLQGVDKDQVHRGAVFAVPGTLAATSMIDVDVRLLPDARPIDSGSELFVLAGTAEVAGRIYWIGNEGEPPKSVEAGRHLWAQIRLSEPLALEAGERIILRRTVPDRTVGGAKVLDPLPWRFRRRNVEARRRLLAVLSAPNDLVVSLAALVRSEPSGLLSRTDAALRLGVATSVLKPLQSPDLLPLSDGERWMHKEALESVSGRLLETVAQLHRDLPMRIGFTKEDLKGRLAVEPQAMDVVLEHLLQQGLLVADKQGLRAGEHKVELSEAQQAAMAALERDLERHGLDTPNAENYLADRPDGTELVSYMLQTGRLVRINQRHIVLRAVHDKLVADVRAYIGQHGSIETGDFKDLTGLSRKLAIPLQEHLDAIGVTRRQGNARVLRDGA